VTIGDESAGGWGVDDLGIDLPIHLWDDDDPDAPRGSHRAIAWRPGSGGPDWRLTVSRLTSSLEPGGYLLLQSDGRIDDAKPLLRELSAAGYAYIRHVDGCALLRRDRLGILYLAPWVSVGGSDKGTVDWFRHLSGTAFRRYLMTTQVSDNKLLPLIEDHADEIWSLPDVLPGRLMPAFILDFVEARQVNVVHIMNSRLGFDLLPAIKVSRPHVRTVVQLHVEEEDRSGYCRYVCTRYDNLVDRYSVTSATLGEALLDYDVSPSKISVIYTGIDHAVEFNPDARTSDTLPGEGTGESEQPFRILFAGRLTEQKDPLLMVRVVRALRDAGSSAVVEVVGEGELRPSVEAAVVAAGLAGHVRFHGVTLDMADWYTRTDVTLLTSRFEGVPFVVFEAMAMRHPVVAPDVGSIREILDESSGFLVRDRTDVSAFVGSLLRLERDPALRRRMGDAARRRVVAELGVERMAADHESLYRELADQYLDEVLFQRMKACPG
jgi:glycosyltransferase involved in cell wall biosynthesis